VSPIDLYKGLKKVKTTLFVSKGDCFRNLWGKYAGWTQTIMFIDDLKGFQKAKSDSLLVKSESQPNLLSNIKREVKEEPIVPEESVDEDNRKGKKRPNLTETDNVVKKMKKKKKSV